MTKNSISGIFGLIREAFGDSDTSIANIYTLFCNSGRRGVVDALTVLLSNYIKCGLFFLFICSHNPIRKQTPAK